jgi:hypothetical protein
MRVLNNRHPQTHASEKLLLQFFHRHFQAIRNQPDFRPANPDVPPLRPSAATPALQALKVQPSRIPRKFIAENHSNYFTTKLD